MKLGYRATWERCYLRLGHRFGHSLNIHNCWMPLSLFYGRRGCRQESAASPPGMDMTSMQEEVYYPPRSISRGLTAHLAGPRGEPRGQPGGGGGGGNLTEVPMGRNG